jgi:hypothetical protein
MMIMIEVILAIIMFWMIILPINSVLAMVK